MAKYKKFPKVDLEDSTIVLNNLIDERTIISTVVAWGVDDFRKLEKDVFYMRSVKTIDSIWTFRLCKHKGTLILAMHSNENGRVVKFRFTKPDGFTLVQILPQEIKEGLYVAEYSLSHILEPKNQILTDDKLHVYCGYTSNVISFYDTVPYGSWRNKLHSKILGDNLREIFLRSLHFDFTIRVENVLFRAHRLILAARSGYFKELFEKFGFGECAEERFNTHPSVMNEVLLYVYSAELKVMNVECTIEVLRLANTLKIDGLINRCIACLKENITMKNVYRIIFIAVEYEIIELKNAGIHYLMKLNGGVLDIDAWKIYMKHMYEIKADPTLRSAIRDFKGWTA